MNGSDRIRILIVENEGLVGCDMAACLTGLGYRVVGTCPTGEEALRLYDELRPELVLMDVHLDGALDGIETTKRLQQKGDVAVVYVTACADQETVQRARETQPHGYLLKPFNQDELRLAVEVAATRHLNDLARVRREQSYFEAFQSLADGVIAADLAGVIVFMNPAAARITGWEQQQVVGRSLHEVFRIYHASGEPAAVELSSATQPAAERTVWLTTLNGNRVAVQDRSTPLRDQAGQLTGVVILFRGLSVTVSEEPPSPSPAERAAQAPLVDVVESISDPLIALDSRWQLIYANASAQKLFERGPEKLLGANLWDLLPTATRESHYEALAHALLHRESVTRELYFEEKQTWLEVRGHPFAEGLLVLMQDITSRREEAERRNRMDRLESLGLLARGFAHEFNNLLTVLLGNISLAEMRLRSAVQLPELHTAKHATLQAQGLVQQLLTFARGGAPIKRPTQLGDLVEQFFLHHSRATRIEYRLELAPHLPNLAVDPAQIRRLLGNLIRNAEQAQPEGGVITVRCLAADPGEMFPHDMLSDLPSLPTGVVIEVNDRGEGISTENLAHIFEPYFSTRKAENATGLGLTVCESIAKAHGGSIAVRSEAANGTTVRFYLPVDAEGEEVDAMGISSAFESAPQSSVPRILVLEDDPLVRSLIVRNLSSQNYEIAESAEGSETVRLYQESLVEGRPYDLVILDLSIPNGMGGVRAMERLRQLDPEVLAIVSSGYSDDPVMAKPAAYGFAAVLPKPYEPADMIRLVKTVLAQRTVRK
ncbi:PAS domain S-box-containing protein [Prosthecobacter fusiformis]|uniref:histidine kinase n=1 Tax=Prosthecobacter fusiformis TaxID=48464 RepID=A0A4R7S152_9BACT|nr:response regulator [Prosthecobacter fusiformis]TDU71196.1 PAS domain S-box-containing protein [Prosthecobacter fusiformis]